MAEVLRSFTAICTPSHGFHSECNSGRWRKKTHAQCFCCALTSSLSSRKTCRKLNIVDGLLMAPMAVECESCSGTWQLRIPRRFCIIGAPRKVTMATFTSFNSGLVCEEEAVNMSIKSRKDQFLLSSYEQEVPPWGNSAVQEELSAGRKGSPSFSNLGSSSSSNSQRKPCLSETKLHFLEERDEGMLSKRILSLSRSNKVRSAVELYTSMEVSGLQPNAHACNSLLSCLLRNGSLDDVLRVFEMMRKKDMATDHASSLILKAVASARGCDSALEMFMEMEGEGASKRSFDVIVYNTMISVCGKAKNWLQTERIWRRIRENACSGTRVTYCLLISAFVQCGQTELAIAAYHEMIQNGLEPSEDVMKAIVAACTKEGEWAVALNTFQQMLGIGFKPNIIAYNSLISCLGKAGETNLAFSIYDLMKSSEHTPDVYTWNALLGALYRCDRYADVLRLFESIRREKSCELNAHLYNTALMSCQRLGLWDRSLQLLWLMEASGMAIPTASYNLVISACENARKPEVALQVYQHMSHKKCIPDTFTHLSLIRACVWGSLWNEVEEILEHVAPNASLYNAIIQGFCLRGKIMLAKKMYTRMRSIGLKADGKTRALMLQHLSEDSVGKHPRFFARNWKNSCD